VVGTQVLRAFLFAGDVPAPGGGRAIKSRSMRSGAGCVAIKILRAPGIAAMQVAGHVGFAP
jgi:hypothetical protein